MKLAVVIGSTRPNRQTIKQAKWVASSAKQDDDLEVEMIDLADYPMPLFDEPMSPRFNPDRQINPIAQKWLSKIEEFDAYIFVTPEYNHSIPAVLKNAFDYITWEIKRKPATVVSHGTVGGARATMHLKEIISESRAIAIPSAVAMAGMSEAIDEEGKLSQAALDNPHGPQFALNNALEELKWYAQALKQAREQSA